MLLAGNTAAVSAETVVAAASAAILLIVNIYDWFGLLMEMVEIAIAKTVKNNKNFKMVIEDRYWLINKTRHVWHNQLPPCIIGFKKYIAVLEELGEPLKISLLPLPQTVLEKPCV